MNLESYMSFIAPQWFDLLFKFDLKYARHFRRVAGSLFSRFARTTPQLCFLHFTKPVIEPLLTDSTTATTTTITTETFRIGLENLYVLFVECTEPNWLTISQIPIDLISMLFEVYARMTMMQRTNLVSSESWKLRETMKKSIEDVIKLYAKMMPSGSEMMRFLTMDLVIDGLLENRFELNLGCLEERDNDDGEMIENEEEINKGTDIDKRVFIVCRPKGYKTGRTSSIQEVIILFKIY